MVLVLAGWVVLAVAWAGPGGILIGGVLVVGGLLTPLEFWRSRRS
jgi:hypothetical protein